MDKAKSPEIHGTKQPTQPVGPAALRAGLILALVALLAGLYLAQASEIAASGRRIEALRQQQQDLQRQNAEKLDQIAVEGSIPRLQERAAKLGFAPATQVEYLPVTAVPPDTTLTPRRQWMENR